MGRYWVLLGFNGLNTVLPGFSWFDWVLPSFTGFVDSDRAEDHWNGALLGFTGFSDISIFGSSFSLDFIGWFF